MMHFFHFFWAVIFYFERKHRIAEAIKNGMFVGKSAKFVGSQFFGSEPYLISVGDNSLITDGVRFVTHDGGIQVPYIKSGMNLHDVYGKKSIFSPIVIGDNVFVGVAAIILPGTVIGNDSIVAAGAVVKGRFESGSVIAGNPARVIGTVQEFFDKNQSRVLDLSGLSGVKRKERVISELALLE